MNIQEVQAFLETESSNGNKLAKAYINLLKDATPEMREFWYVFLGNIVTATLKLAEKESEKGK